ncbi:MAG: hypothetical protein GEU90_21085 [Gemmatimonas sp.]|nr:hypothetical protein [Gemmatimonas sp.]
MATKVRTIVLGVAEVDGGDPHLRSAMAITTRLGATLHVVHAFHVPDPGLYPYPEMSYFSPEAIDRFARGVQERLEESVRSLPGGEDAVCRTTTTPADMAVLDRAKEVDADLILVGSTRRGRLGSALLGTTAQRIIRGASVPVFVLHSEELPARSRILLTTDLSPLSDVALKRGTELAVTLRGSHRPELRALLVLGYEVPLPPPLRDGGTVEIAEDKLNESLQDLRDAGWAVEASVRIGEPADQIRDMATQWTADLIVLGTHGRTGATRFLIGSIAESVLRRPPCDVLVIPNGAITQGTSSNPASAGSTG